MEKQQKDFKIEHETEALLPFINKVLDKLAQVKPRTELYQLQTALLSLQKNLFSHFSTEEESGGVFQTITEASPRLEEQINELCTEHNKLREQMAKMCQHIDELAKAEEKAFTWLQKEMEEFTKKVKNHECVENDLITEAYSLDIGSLD